ncbi:MAG: ATPase [Actinomycetia bacterium]|nr:ATPase [Actinomycetes bacterium]
MSEPTHVYETYIRCEPEAAWRAMVDGGQTVQYFYGTRVESDWQPGSSLRYLAPDGAVVADGEVVAVDEPRRLEIMFHPRWDPELEAEGPARTVWFVDEVNGLTRVRVEYHDLDPAGRILPDFTEGIPLIVAGMKTLLETGGPLS